MPYTDKTKLVERFGEKEIADLLDRNADDADDAGALDAVVADTDEMIDGFLRGRYTLPLSAESLLLGGIAADIVRYRLYDIKAPAEVKYRYEEAIRFLKMLRDGEMLLDVTEAQSGGSAGASTERTREITDDTLRGFMGGL